MSTDQDQVRGEPRSPALLFDPDGSMYVIHDLALTDQLLETPEEVHRAFDGLGRPLEGVGPAGDVTLRLMSEHPEEPKVRARVAHYYSVHASRHPTRIPPQEEDLAAFILAVANDEVIE